MAELATNLSYQLMLEYHKFEISLLMEVHIGFFKRLGHLSRKKFKQKSDNSTYIQYFKAVFRSLLMFYFCSFMSTKILLCIYMTQF